jgi:hypothetical protein
VCGVPKPDLEHAVHMARFAMAAIIRFYEVIKRLELMLGPDTVGALGRMCSCASFYVAACFLTTCTGCTP